MTPVGHTLTGLAIGYAFCPTSFSWRFRMAVLGSFVLLANTPDLPLPGWGHSRYDISHSVFVTGVFVAGMTVVLFSARRRWQSLTPGLIFGAAMAWCSHLLLDTFYSHGLGLPMFWPFSNTSVSLPIPFFSTMRLSPLFCEHNLSVFAIEAAFYGPLLAVVVIMKWIAGRRLASFDQSLSGESRDIT